MGASIAGLWTARALIDHFDEVIILERDRLPDGADFRSGAPQARQYHGLLKAGLQQLRSWFPGLEEELISAGAVPYDVTLDVRVRVRGRWYPQFPSGLILLSGSRLLLESSIRRRLRQNPCIRFVEGVEVVGLHSDDQKRRVTGVQIRNRRGGVDQGEPDPILTADLVVDALGVGPKRPNGLWNWDMPLRSKVKSIVFLATSPAATSANRTRP